MLYSDYEHLIANVLIPQKYQDEINANFQSLVIRFGKFVCGDEKLQRFTGKSPNVVYNPHNLVRWDFGIMNY